MRLRLNGAPATNGAGELPAPEGAPARIGRGLTVTGTVTGNVDVTIDGALAGELRSRTVTVGPRADVDGALKAHEINIAGRVHGRIEAMCVHIHPGAEVDATIYHHKLDIERGAVVRGLRPWRPLSDMERRRAAW
jgi:cytoskeletal protein CcmA (bactofilin family)